MGRPVYFNLKLWPLNLELGPKARLTVVFLYFLHSFCPIGIEEIIIVLKVRLVLLHLLELVGTPILEFLNLFSFIEIVLGYVLSGGYGGSWKPSPIFDLDIFPLCCHYLWRIH